jgi:release factor glutamine methyltransferase
MDVQKALDEARARLTPISESAAHEARALLCRAMEVEVAWLLAHPEATITGEQLSALRGFVDRRVAGEPLPYLFEEWAFYDRAFHVTPAVLIPRPETELIVERALSLLWARRAVVVDVGTGSGVIAIPLAVHRPAAQVYATDISREALAVAEHNAERHNAPVTFLHGDLLMPILEAGIAVDLLLANLPYIPSEQVDTLPVARFEPRLALDGGADGLALITRLLDQAQKLPKPPEHILLEVMSGQSGAVRDLAQARFPHANVQVVPDLAGHDRMVDIEPVPV